MTKLGPAVTKFAIGDKIFTEGWPSIPDQCGTQEYAIVLADVAAKVPPGMSDDDAATLALNPFTAFAGLFGKGTFGGLGIPPPFGSEESKAFHYEAQKILIIGGGTACGKFAIQFSRFLGIGTIVVVASKSSKSEAELKKLGATHVIDRHLSFDEISSQIQEIVGDDLVYAFDCINGEKGGLTLGAKALSSTKRGALAILVSAGTVDEAKLGEKKAGWERRGVLAHPTALPEINKPYWDHLLGWIEDKVITPTPYSVIDGLDADKVNEALDKYRDQKSIVKPHAHL